MAININATLLGQAGTFAVLVIFTKKFVWSFLTEKMQERAQKIEAGLAAAERGEQELALAQKKYKEVIAEAKAEAKTIVDKAQTRAQQMIEEAKQKAKVEADRVAQEAQAEIQQGLQQAKTRVREQIISVAMVGAERILSQEIDQAANAALLKDLIDEI